MSNKKKFKNNFKKELRDLLNRHSKENKSGTPDYILANYLNRALKNFNKTSKEREDYVNAYDNDSRSGDERIEESAFNPPDEKKLVYTRDNPFREVD